MKILKILRIAVALTICVLMCSAFVCCGENPPEGDYKITYVYGFDGVTEPYKTVWLNKGETPSQNVGEPKRDGWKFDGWDYDFNSEITSDAQIKAQWSFYSNASADFNDLNSFVGKIGFTKATSGTKTVKYDTATGGEVLVCRAENATSEAVLSIDFGVVFPKGTKIFIKVKYEHNSSVGSGGAAILTDGEFWQSMGVSGEYKEYVYEFTEKHTLESISFRPLTQSVGYTFSIAELDIISNLENVDFNEYEKFHKAFESGWQTIEEKIVYDDGIKSKVYSYKGKPLDPYTYFALNYTETDLPKGSKVHIYMWYDGTKMGENESTVEIGINSEGTSTGYKFGCYVRREWHDYVVEFDRKTTLKRVSLRPWGKGMTFNIKIARIWIEYAE